MTMTDPWDSVPQPRRSSDERALAGDDGLICPGEPIIVSIPADLVIAYGVGNRVVWSADPAIEVAPGDKLDHD